MIEPKDTIAFMYLHWIRTHEGVLVLERKWKQHPARTAYGFMYEKSPIPIVYIRNL